MKRKWWLTLAVSAVLLSGGIPVLAEEVYSLGDVVVTATRNAQENLAAPADIQVITRNELERRHYSDLGAALKDVSGVTIQNYSSNGENYSSNSLYINGSSKIVVLIDGMRANTNGSVSNKFSANELVDMNMVERIEVLRSSASTLYGSDAQGGVINIITRRPEGKEAQVKTTLGATFGSYNLKKWNLSHHGIKGDFYWNLNAQKKKSGNYRDGAGHTIPEYLNTDTYGVIIGKYLDQKSFVEINYSKFKDDYYRDNSKGMMPTLSLAYGKKNDDRIAFRWHQNFGNGWSNDFSIFRNRNFLDDNYLTPSRWMMDLETRGLTNQTVYRNQKHVLTFGVDYYKDRVKKYLDQFTTYTGEKSISATGFFIQDEWSLDSQWTLTAGTRLTDHSVYGKNTSPSISLSYMPNNQTNYYLSFKRFFVAPNQYELFSPFGNTSLKPETGKSFELGIKRQINDTTSMTANVFSRYSKNLIAWAWTGPGKYDGKYMNVNEENGRGFNASFRKQLNRSWSVSADYSYLFIPAAPRQNPNRDGQLPRNAWNIGIHYAQDKWDVELNGRGVISRVGRKADKYPNKLTTFWIWDVGFNYHIHSYCNAFLKVNNLLDKHYTDRTYDLNPANWYPQPGRNFQFGVEYTF